jgi:NRPS condensation-like uncharacterized protein
MLRAELIDAAIYGLMDRHGDMSMHAVVDLRRTYERSELETALAKMVAAFPVLGHRYAPRGSWSWRSWRDAWEPVTEPLSASVHVLAATEAELEPLTNRWARTAIVATRDRPVRLVALVHGRGMRLVLSVLHLAGDGATVAALSRLLGAYLHHTDPGITLDPRRDVRGVVDGLRWFQLPSLAVMKARLAVQPLLDLAGARRSRPYPRCPASEAAWSEVVVGAEELQRARARCAAGTSINDLLVAAVASIAGARSERGPVIVVYTMDLRRYSRTARLLATNASSVLSVKVPRRALGDLASAARAVTRITARHQRRLAGPAFMLAPHLLGAVFPHRLVRTVAPLLGPLMVDAPLARGLIVTNVGRIDDGVRTFGDEIERLRFIGPVVENLPVPVVVAFGYRGELHLSLYAAPGIGDEALATFASELRRAFTEERRSPERSSR